MEKWDFNFSQVLSAIFQSLDIFFKYCFIGLVIGIVFAVIFTLVITFIYRNRCKNDDSKVMYVFAIFILWSGWCLSMLITGGLGGALIAYRTVLVKEMHQNSVLFSAPESAEAYIILGNLGKLSEMDCTAVGNLIKEELDVYHETKRFSLYQLIIGTNEFAEKLPHVIDRQLQLPEIVNKLHQYGDAITFGSQFSSATLRTSLLSALNKSKDIQEFSVVWEWFIFTTQSFEFYLEHHPEYQGEITVEQFCEAQVNFLFDYFLDQILWQKFFHYLCVAFTVVVTTCIGSFALVFFWTKPQKD